MNLCTGANYSVSLDYMFPTTGPSTLCSITLQYPGLVYGSFARNLVAYSYASTAGVWLTMSATFQAKNFADSLDIIMECGPVAGVYIHVDNVQVKLISGNV